MKYPLAAGALSVILLTQLGSNAAEILYPTLSLGAKAPGFSLPGVDGKTYSLETFADSKCLVVIFTCNHCPTAQYYEDRIKSLVTDYKSKGVAFVAISPNDPVNGVRPDELGYTDVGDTLEEMVIRARHKQFNFPYLYGAEQHEAASRAYGPVVTPHVFIFDEHRKLRYQGRIDDSERIEYVNVQDTRNALDALLDGQEPAVTQTKVVGCSIKWSDKSRDVQRYWEKYNKEPVKIAPIDAQGLHELRANQSGPAEERKLRLVNFWATWCGPCITEFPDLMDIHRWYRQREFELITVAAHYPDEEQEALRFLEKQHASNRNFIFGDPNKHQLMEAFDKAWSGALPFTLLIDPDGNEIYRKEGSFDPLELKRVIVRELNQRKPW